MTFVHIPLTGTVTYAGWEDGWGSWGGESVQVWEARKHTASGEFKARQIRLRVSR